MTLLRLSSSKCEPSRKRVTSHMVRRLIKSGVLPPMRLLNMASDRSALAPAALTEVIGENRWTDGLPILLTLLGDTRNYVRHPECFE